MGDLGLKLAFNLSMSYLRLQVECSRVCTKEKCLGKGSSCATTKLCTKGTCTCIFKRSKISML